MRTELATFRLVAQCLNHLRHRVPPKNNISLSLIGNCIGTAYVSSGSRLFQR